MHEKGEKYLQIGELAKKSNVTPRTIKHYEDKGIIQPLKKTQGGFRLYDNDKLKSLKRIKSFQQAGLSLKEVKKMEEIKRLLEENRGQKTISSDMLDEKLSYLEKQLNKINERLEEIIMVKKYLEEMMFYLKEGSNK